MYRNKHLNRNSFGIGVVLKKSMKKIWETLVGEKWWEKKLEKANTRNSHIGIPLSLFLIFIFQLLFSYRMAKNGKIENFSL